MKPRTSVDNGESEKSTTARIDLSMSNTTTKTLSMQNVSTTSSAEPSHLQEPHWPRTWRAYVAWLGCFFLMFNSWGLVNAYGTFASYYAGFSLRLVNQLELNLIGSTQCFLVLLLSGPVGRLLDAGHFRIAIGTGAVLVPFGMFMLSIAHPSGNQEANYINIWITQGFVTGLGMSCYFVSSSQVAATWFPRRKGLAVGVVACGASIAGVVYPTMTRYAIDSVGFNNAIRLVAGVAAITGAFSFVFATPDPAHVHIKPQTYRRITTWIDPEAFRNKSFCWFSASVAFLFFGFYPIFFNIEEWAASSGFGARASTPMTVKYVSETSDALLQSFWLLTIMNGASTIGRLTMASFCDKTGQLNMHICAQIISALFVLVLWPLASSTTHAIVFCVLFGMTSGAVIGLPPASIANILTDTYNRPENKHLAHSKLGHWTGMMYSIAAIPALTGPVISGHLLTRYNDYITVMMWSGANLLISAACMIVSRWHLTCRDGERVSAKLGRMITRDLPVSEKGERSHLSDTVIEAGNDLNGISKTTTRVPAVVGDDGRV